MLPHAELAHAGHARKIVEGLDVGVDRVLQAMAGQNDLLVHAPALRLRPSPRDEASLPLRLRRACATGMRTGSK